MTDKVENSEQEQMSEIEMIRELIQNNQNGNTIQWKRIEVLEKQMKDLEEAFTANSKIDSENLEKLETKLNQQAELIEKIKVFAIDAKDVSIEHSKKVVVLEKALQDIIKSCDEISDVKDAIVSIKTEVGNSPHVNKKKIQINWE